MEPIRMSLEVCIWTLACALVLFHVSSALDLSVDEHPDLDKKPLQTGKNRDPAISKDEYREHFLAWRQKYKMDFEDPLEDAKRLTIFSETHDMILDHNSKGYSYTLGHNQFSHLTWEEYTGKYLMESEALMEDSVPKTGRPYKGDGRRTITWNVDWRKRGGVSAVSDQGHCQSCWAYATTGALEGHYFVKTGKSVEFSPQYLIDCTEQVTRNTCLGGWPVDTMEQVKKRGGLPLRKDYPDREETWWNGWPGDCNRQQEAQKVNFTINSVQKVTSFWNLYSVKDQLEDLLDKVGVVAVGIGQNQAFKHYRSGIYDPAVGGCNMDPKSPNSTKPNHAVLLIGYGQLGPGPFACCHYWLFKNSAGTDWGEDGYGKIKREMDNPEQGCGILKTASYPVLNDIH